jgi:hypothetical protein
MGSKKKLPTVKPKNFGVPQFERGHCLRVFAGITVVQKQKSNAAEVQVKGEEPFFKSVDTLASVAT